MNTTRATALPLLLLGLTSACTIIDKDLLESTSETGAGETTGADPTSTGSTAPTGDGGAAETTGAAEDGTSTGDEDTTGTTGSLQEGLQLITPDASPMCMPRCVLDLDPSSPVLDANCSLFVVDSAAQTEAAIMPCLVTNFEWVVPAGAARCFAELIDKNDQTPGQHDQLSPACSELGFNLEFLIVGEPVPLDLLVGADCEVSDNPARDCPDL